MAGMFEGRKGVVRVIDPGAGVGSLSAAFIGAMCRSSPRPEVIALTVYEIDPVLVARLRVTLDLCRGAAREAGIRVDARVTSADFLEIGAGDLFSMEAAERFDCAILNPPYRKIRTESRERKLLRRIGLETTNLYSGFVALTAKLLVPGGEMVAITPRSFCNGPYFEPFRGFFLQNMRFRRIHVFDARDAAFADDRVLQENVVFRAQKTTDSCSDVVVSSSSDPKSTRICSRVIEHDELVRPGDPHAFIHIVPNGDGDRVRRQMRGLEASLADLGLSVSTGRVVDFRAKEFLLPEPAPDSVPPVPPDTLPTPVNLLFASAWDAQQESA